MLADEIRSALDALPEDFRMAVLLVDVQELSYKEAADALGCPIGTVMSRLHRGRRMLKERLVHQAVALGLISAKSPEALAASQQVENTEEKSSSCVELAAFRSKKGA
jgi:RNA polymerase sigma-70 factor (ECF subfamily)